MSDVYDSDLKGPQVDESVKSSYLTVADISARGALDTNLFTTGKIVEVLDNGSGIKQRYEWNGASWDDYVQDKILISNGASVESEDGNLSINIHSEGDDKGWDFSGGQVTVPDSEIIAGKDSYPVEIAFKYNAADETGTTIINATNVTTILQSDDLSATSMFANNLAGDILIIGADEPYFGVKMKYDSNGTLEPENILGEYLNSSDSWLAQNFMVTNSTLPYQSVGWELSSFPSEQVRFGQSLDPNNVSDWALRTLNINGTNYTKYWARVRLVSPITAVPNVQQVKHSPSRVEINSGGIIEFYGSSRCSFTLQSGAKNLINNSSGSPANQDVVYFESALNGADVEADYDDNQYNNNTVDNSIIVQSFVQSLDTSTSLLLSISYYPETNNGGDIEFTAQYRQVTDGFVYNDSSAPPDGIVSTIDTIPINSINIRRTMSLEIPINTVGSAGGGVVINLARDARGSNPNDTLVGNVVLTNFRLDGRRWRT